MQSDDNKKNIMSIFICHEKVQRTFFQIFLPQYLSRDLHGFVRPLQKCSRTGSPVNPIFYGQCGGKTTFSKTFPRQYSAIWKVSNGRGEFSLSLQRLESLHRFGHRSTSRRHAVPLFDAVRKLYRYLETILTIFYSDFPTSNKLVHYMREND